MNNSRYLKFNIEIVILASSFLKHWLSQNAMSIKEYMRIIEPRKGFFDIPTTKIITLYSN